MKKLIIIIPIVIIILFCGCDSYDLGGFVLPDDQEFFEIIQKLDTPKKISDYMLNNFTYKLNYFPASPYELVKSKEGDCNDFSCFGKFVAHYHGYTVYEIKIFYGSIFNHSICVYEENLNNGKYSFTTNRFYFCCYKTFREMVIRGASTVDMEWEYYKVHDYYDNIIEEGVK